MYTISLYIIKKACVMLIVIIQRTIAKKMLIFPAIVHFGELSFYSNITVVIKYPIYYFSHIRFAGANCGSHSRSISSICSKYIH